MDNEQKPEGFEPVDVSHLPEEDQDNIQARFDRLYGQVKMSDRRNKAMESVLLEQQKALVDISQKLTETERTTAKKSIEDGIRMAEEFGDMPKANQLRQSLIEMNMEEKLQAALAKKQPNNYSPENVLDTQMAEVTDPYENAYLTQAMAERAPDGNYMRPWAQRGHPDLQVALQEAEVIWTSPKFANKTVEEKMKELDRRMGTPQRKQGSSVLSGGGNQKTQQGAQLTPAEQQVAVRLYSKLPSDQAIAKYAAAKARA